MTLLVLSNWAQYLVPDNFFSTKSIDIFLFLHENRRALVRITGIVAQIVDHLLCDWEVVGMIPDRVIPKTLKTVLAAVLLGTRHEESRARNQNFRCQYNVTVWNIMSSLGAHYFSEAAL